MNAVLHHTWLQSRGGAVRVADLLAQGQQGAGWAVARSFELPETRGAQGITPGDVAGTAGPGRVLHVHGSGDWAALLGGVARAGLGDSTVLTLHDCRLLTGGCPYPLDCDGWLRGCCDPCPRGFARAPQVQSAIREQALAASPLLVTPSGWLAHMVAKALPGLRVKVVPNGVPWPDAPVDKDAARKALGLSGEGGLVLFAAHGGERAAYKAGGGWRALWRNIKARAPHAVGWMVGGEDTGRDGDLAWWPYLDRAAMDRFLAAADVLAYPSLADNHPLVVLEAQSRCVAVAASAVGGIPEQVRHGETGLLAQPGDMDGLAERVAGLLASPGRARRMGLAAWEAGRERFAAGRMARDYLAAYGAAAS